MTTAPGRALRTALRIALLLGVSATMPAPALESELRAGEASGDLVAQAGTPVDGLLRRLEEEGLRLVWSSRLVPPELEVAATVRADSPAALLELVLRPHGLAVERQGATLVVVAWNGPPAGPRHLHGRVLSRTTRDPVDSVRLVLLASGRETISDAAGRFEIALPAEPDLRLQARRVGFVVEEFRIAETGPGSSAADPLEILLEPAPLAAETLDVQPSRLALLDDDPASPLALSRQEIEALPHLSGDIFHALDLLPGIASDDISAEFRVRGGRENDTLIEIDGQELYDAYHLKEFDNALSLVAASTLSGLSLSTGAFPATYGDRMGGVLEMTTRPPRSPRRWRLSISLLDLQVETAGRSSGRLSWMLSLRPGSAKLAGKLFGEPDPDFWDAFGKLETEIGSRQTLGLRLLGAGDRLTYESVRNDEEHRFDTAYASRYLWLTHQMAIGDRLLVVSSGSISHLDRNRQGGETEEEKDFDIRDRRDLDVEALSQAWHWQAASSHSLSAGVDVRRYTSDYDYRSDRTFFSPLKALRAEPTDGPYDFRGEIVDDTLGSYVVEHLRPGSSTSLELGLRYDRHSAEPGSLWSPRAALAWSLGERSVARLAWGRYSQGQRAYEVGVEDGDPTLYPVERSEQWVVGFERTFAARSAAALSALRLEVYRREVSNPRPRYESLYEPLEAFVEGELDRVRLEPERSRAEGVELFLHGRPGGRFQWWFNYTWATSEDRLDATWVPRVIDQRHTINLDLATALGRDWQLNLAWRYHTGRPTTAILVDTIEVPDPVGDDGDEPGDADDVDDEESLALRATLFVPRYGPLNRERLAPYHRLDLRLSRAWGLRRGRLTFFADVQNLYDRRNIAGFDVEFDEDAPAVIVHEEPWPGLLASAGITWEF